MGDEFLKLFLVLQGLTFYSFKNDNPVLEEYLEKRNIQAASYITYPCITLTPLLRNKGCVIVNLEYIYMY
jgi:hypothetical protein